MKESILHYLWQYKLFDVQELYTTTGAVVEVIDVGRPNTDAGPDFFNAKIKIDATLWAGNIEIHSLSSDWYKHHHHQDAAYDSVVLHVVMHADVQVKRTNGEPIPQTEIVVPEYIRNNFDSLQQQKKWIPCEDKINQVPPILINSFKNRLVVERLERKTDNIEQLLVATNNHWEEAFYVTLARSYGFGTNSQPFERMARQTPLAVLAKHKDNLFQIEAILFGQAGLLNEIPQDNYQDELAKEYFFFCKKFKLSHINPVEWKMMRLRPDNFPYVRIAQFAALIHRSSKMFSKIIETDDVEHLHQLFNAPVSDYWRTHYRFGKESKPTSKRLGKTSINSLIINTVIPFIFTYNKKNSNGSEKALNLLELFSAERNSIIAHWQSLGITAQSAYDTQALLQLKKCYCDLKKCLHCAIGHKVLTIK